MEVTLAALEAAFGEWAAGRASNQPRRRVAGGSDPTGTADAGACQRYQAARANPRAALLVDHYVEDWRSLWYVLVRGRARLVDRAPEQQRAIVALRKKYPQYRTTVPLAAEALVIAIDVRRLRHWQASSSGRRGYATGEG